MLSCAGVRQISIMDLSERYNYSTVAVFRLMRQTPGESHIDFNPKSSLRKAKLDSRNQVNLLLDLMASVGTCHVDYLLEF